MEREQNIREAGKKKLAANYTLSGAQIEGGLNILGSARICGGCGREMAPYLDFCCAGN